MEKITYIINSPIKLTDYFEIIQDKSEWDGTYINENAKEKNNEKKQIILPNRDRNIIKFNDLLIPKKNSDYSDKYCNRGIYLLFFKDFNKYYVGISSKEKGGILERLRKHRAKATGTNTSNVGFTDINEDGWRAFSKERFKKFGITDQLNDCYLVTINIKNQKNPIKNEKKKLMFIESQLSLNFNEQVKKMISYIYPPNISSSIISNWKSFNDRALKAVEIHENNFIFNKV